jgi:hypothetical protein
VEGLHSFKFVAGVLGVAYEALGMEPVRVYPKVGAMVNGPLPDCYDGLI